MKEFFQYRDSLTEAISSKNFKTLEQWAEEGADVVGIRSERKGDYHSPEQIYDALSTDLMPYLYSKKVNDLGVHQSKSGKDYHLSFLPQDWYHKIKLSGSRKYSLRQLEDWVHGGSELTWCEPIGGMVPVFITPGKKTSPSALKSGKVLITGLMKNPTDSDIKKIMQSVK